MVRNRHPDPGNYFAAHAIGHTHERVTGHSLLNDFTGFAMAALTDW